MYIEADSEYQEIGQKEEYIKQQKINLGTITKEMWAGSFIPLHLED